MTCTAAGCQDIFIWIHSYEGRNHKDNGGLINKIGDLMGFIAGVF
jgi:hypothetical protein